MDQRTADRAMTLPGHYYTGRSIYDAETERIFLKRWLYAGRASTIREPGQYFLHNVDTESVIVVRDGEGRVRAFHNVCRHRGTRLCSAPEGRFSKSIQCPYHAWTYALDGSLIGAPHMREVEAFNKSDYPLRGVSVGEFGGGVFLNLDSGAPALAEVFAPLQEKVDRWEFERLQVAHRIEYDVAANWKLVVQNYSECYHCPSLHPLLNRLTPYRNSSNDFVEGPFLGGPMQLSDGNESMTTTGRACATKLAGLTTEEHRLVFYYTVFPNMLLSLFPDYVVVHRLDRLGPDRTRIVCDWLFHEDTVSRADFDPRDAVEFWNMTNKQDWNVSELSHSGIASRAYEPGPYSNLESMLAAWDREYLRAMEE